MLTLTWLILGLALVSFQFYIWAVDKVFPAAGDTLTSQGNRLMTQLFFGLLPATLTSVFSRTLQMDLKLDKEDPIGGLMWGVLLLGFCCTGSLIINIWTRHTTAGNTPSTTPTIKKAWTIYFYCLWSTTLMELPFG